MENEKNAAHSEIEKALLQDQAGVYRDRLLTLFSMERLKITQELNKGVVPEEYAVLSGLLEAIEQSVVVVNKMWAVFQDKE
jgi:hypothetical protein